MYPKEFRYTKEHQWVRVEDSLGTVGITEYAQKELSEVIYAQLPKVGDHVTAGEPMGTVESVKATSEIFSPVSGEVTAVNPVMLSNPQLLNADPHGEAWLVQVRMSDPSELAKLISADEYEKLVKQEEAL
jgi:glycine cleavage system H protein